MEILDNGTTEKTRTKATSSYRSYYFLTKAGNKYHVPESLYNAVLIGDSFYIYKTLIFRKPVRLSWCEEDSRCYIMAIGVINGNYFGYGVMGYLIIYPLLVILGLLRIATSGKQTNVFFCFAISLGTLAFYLFY